MSCLCHMFCCFYVERKPGRVQRNHLLPVGSEIHQLDTAGHVPQTLNGHPGKNVQHQMA